MLLQSIRKSPFICDPIEVTYLGGANFSDEELKAQALKDTGIARATLWGMKVRRYDDGGAVVVLVRD